MSGLQSNCNAVGNQPRAGWKAQRSTDCALAAVGSLRLEYHPYPPIPARPLQKRFVGSRVGAPPPLRLPRIECAATRLDRSASVRNRRRGPDRTTARRVPLGGLARSPGDERPADLTSCRWRQTATTDATWPPLRAPFTPLGPDRHSR
jgi:hypothetical protein